MTEDLHIFGKVKAIVYVSISASDADLAIKLNQVDTEGKVTNIVDGIQRVSLSQNRRERTFLKGDEPIKVEVDLGYISTYLPEGYSLKLQITGSNYPKYGLNPGTKENALTTNEFKSYEQTIHFSPDLPTSLIIPLRE